MAGFRERVFLVSKVLPSNAGRGRIARACEGSLRRLRTDRLDLDLLHWRGPAFDLMPALAARGISAMAYSPVEQGRLPKTGTRSALAERQGARICQVALAWALRTPDVVAIPKAGSVAHVQENAGAADIALTAADLQTIDAAFPIPIEAGSRSAPRLHMKFGRYLNGLSSV